MAASSPTWVQADLAVQALGAATVGIELSASRDDLIGTLVALEVSTVVAQDEEQLDKVLEVRTKCPTVAHILVVDTRGVSLDGTGILSFADVEASGEGPDALDFYAAATRSVGAAAVATVTPAGAPGRFLLLSHDALLTAGATANESLALHAGDEVLSFVHLGDVLERTLAITCLLTRRYTVNFGSGLVSLAADARSVQPTVVHGSAAVWGAIVASVEARMNNASGLKQRLYRSARSVGSRVVDRRLDDRLGGLTRLRLAPWSVLVDRPLRDKLGLSRLRAGLSSDGILDSAAFEYLWGLGVPVLPVLSQPESGGLVAANVPGAVRPGTVGRAVAGVTVESDEQGELVARSPSTPPYLDAPAGANDWRSTGWKGSVDTDGFVHVEEPLRRTVVMP
jgi:long-chain acyl-CoA synthetase